jgi:hypothetical protein
MQLIGNEASPFIYALGDCASYPYHVDKTIVAIGSTLEVSQSRVDDELKWGVGGSGPTPTEH